VLTRSFDTVYKKVDEFLEAKPEIERLHRFFNINLFCDILYNVGGLLFIILSFALGGGGLFYYLAIVGVVLQVLINIGFPILHIIMIKRIVNAYLYRFPILTSKISREVNLKLLLLDARKFKLFSAFEKFWDRLWFLRYCNCLKSMKQVNFKNPFSIRPKVLTYIQNVRAEVYMYSESARMVEKPSSINNIMIKSYEFKKDLREVVFEIFYIVNQFDKQADLTPQEKEDYMTLFILDQLLE